MAGVLVFGDTVGGALAPASLEMAAAGAALARDFNEPLIGALIGLQRARSVEMTGMPELIAVLHSFVGLAAVLIWALAAGRIAAMASGQ